MPAPAPTLPRSVAAFAIALGAVAVSFALARFWGANPDHLDRLLILIGASYAAWHLAQSPPVLPSAPTRLGYVPLFAGAAAFPVGWFLLAQVGPKPVVLWWLTGAWLLAVAGAGLVRCGWPRLRHFAFPLAFTLFALPVPNRVFVPLQFGLQSATTSAAAWVLPVLGTPVERNGFVLSLPSGDLGVAEACSGVRSITALTAIAAFVAWWSAFAPLRGTVLVLLSIPIIAAVNAVRVVVSGLLQEHAGPEYVRGNSHEGLGIGMIVLGLGLIVGLAGLLRRKSVSDTGGAPVVLEPVPPARGFVATVLLACSAFATVAAQLLGMGAEREIVAAAPLEQIPMKLGRWSGADIPVPPDVAEMLTPDAVLRRVYRDFGYEIHAWAIFWSSNNMVKGYHHPDVCWPNRGFRLAHRSVESLPVEGGGTLPVTAREFARGTERQLIVYWTQEGRRVWSEDDERRVQATGDSHDWLGDRLFNREPPAATGRIVVLLATPVWGDGTAIRSQTLDFAAKFANEVHRACPWAAPRGE